MNDPNCHETHQNPHDEYCCMYGIESNHEIIEPIGPQKNRCLPNMRKKWILVLIINSLIFVPFCLLESFSVQQTGHPCEKEIKSTLTEYYYYWDNNVYNRLMHMFWYDVDRFQNETNISREEVVSLIKRDKANSGIISSTSRPRWNTMTIKDLSPYEGFSIVFMEDYEIERTDKNKATKFVLENHVEMDYNFNITSIYQRTISSR